jgi:hypothetical protein
VYDTQLARVIKEELQKIHNGESDKSREELLAWFEQFKTQFNPEELRELRAVLGVKQALSETPFRELVPEGWLRDVLDLTRESESPASFAFLAALTVLSQAVGRKVMVDRGTHALGLDVNALLISPAGRGRRSTICDFVVYGLGAPAGLNIIADSFSFEAFGDELVLCAGLEKLPKDRIVHNTTAMIYAGEMAALLGKGSYVESIIPKLTDILGKTSRFEWRTVKRGGKIVFERPCVNALFTTAPDWLFENIPPAAFGGGLMSRFLVCIQDLPEQVVTWGTKISDEDKLVVVNRLKLCGGTQGVFDRPVGEAWDWYDTWYQAHTKKTLYGELPDERMAPYFSRKHDHVLRMSALLAIAAQDELVFTLERFEQALRIVDWFELEAPRAYAQMSVSPMAGAQRTICDVLQRNKGRMEHSRLQRKVYRILPLADHFKAVMQSLIEMRVVRVERGLGGRGTVYTVDREGLG